MTHQVISRGLRPFQVHMPSGQRYWTVLDDDRLTSVPEADEFLRHMRFGRDQAKSTTRTYAGAVVVGAPADVETLTRRVTELEQQILDLRAEMARMNRIDSHLRGGRT